LGPRALKYAGLTSLLRLLHYDVFEKTCSFFDEESKEDTSLLNLQSVLDMSKNVANSVIETIQNGYFPLIVGGDHSIAIGTVAGVSSAYDNLGIIWVDAHGDVNTPQTTPTGNIHGMPLAINMGFGDSRLTQILGFSPKVKPENVVIIDTRDLDPGEILFLKEQNVTYFSSKDVDSLGVAEVMRQVKNKFERQNVQNLHLSFDLDSLDPSIALGVGTPVTGGLTLEEAKLLLFEISSWKRLVSAEFVELNPLLDVRNQTAQTALSLIEILFK
jgi:arginase